MLKVLFTAILLNSPNYASAASQTLYSCTDNASGLTKIVFYQPTEIQAEPNSTLLAKFFHDDRAWTSTFICAEDGTGDISCLQTMALGGPWKATATIKPDYSFVATSYDFRWGQDITFSGTCSIGPFANTAQ